MTSAYPDGRDGNLAPPYCVFCGDYYLCPEGVDTGPCECPFDCPDEYINEQIALHGLCLDE